MEGFRITCLKCMSTEVEEIQDYEYAADGTKYDTERYFLCKECGQNNRLQPIERLNINWKK